MRLKDIKGRGYMDAFVEVEVVTDPISHKFGQYKNKLMRICMVRGRMLSDDIEVRLVIWNATGPTRELKKGTYLELDDPKVDDPRFAKDGPFQLLVDESKVRIQGRAPPKPICPSAAKPLAPSAKSAEPSLSAGPGLSAAAPPAPSAEPAEPGPSAAAASAPTESAPTESSSAAPYAKRRFPFAFPTAKDVDEARRQRMRRAQQRRSALYKRVD